MKSMANIKITGKHHSQLMKLTLISFLFLTLTLLFFMYRPTKQQQLTQTSRLLHLQPQPQPQPQPKPTQLCTSKLPPNISQTLLHYATTRSTPQQTLPEISVTERVLRRKSPCNFLVFGFGHDSLLWSTLNSGGRTLFLEDDPIWIKRVHSRFPDLHFRHVVYPTKLRQADELFLRASKEPSCGAVADPRESECVLALKSFPEEVYEVEWDVIMVDAPTGFHDEAPGRMTVIYTAGLMARNRRGGGETEVMVHDVDRPVEDRFSRAFLCDLRGVFEGGGREAEAFRGA